MLNLYSFVLNQSSKLPRSMILLSQLSSNKVPFEIIQRLKISSVNTVTRSRSISITRSRSSKSRSSRSSHSTGGSGGSDSSFNSFTTAGTATIKPLRIKSFSQKDQDGRPWNKLSKPKQQKFGNPAKASTLIDENEIDYLEQHAHSISKYNSKFNFHLAQENAKREAIKKLYYARAKTIERKYFKKPEPPNLLTWSAKEQIRFLHEQFPEEWSVDKLADSFPVDKACIKRILNSRLRLHREEDIIQHDLEVRQNWINLKEAIENGQQDSDIYTNLKNINNESLISNASGLSYCPSPPVKKKELKIGPFSSIVKDCFEKKDADLKDEVSLKDKLARLSTVLSDVSQAFDKSLDAKSDSNQSKNLQNETHTYDYQSFSKYRYKQNSQTKSVENQPFTIHERERNVLTAKMNILKQSTTKAKYFVSGNSVYDENGEFLYKKP